MEFLLTHFAGALESLKTLYNTTPEEKQWDMVLLLFVASAAIYFGDRWIKHARKSRVRKQDPFLPQKLADAKLLFSEKDIACRKPRPMHGRPDRVYQLDNGEKIPVDIKTRPSKKVFQTDIIQLSVYALILNGENMPSHAYIRFDSNEGPPRYKIVSLLPYSTVIAIYDRRKALIAGTVEPRGVRVKGQCTGCGHNALCTTKP